jgi:hypothetical protein
MRNLFVLLLVLSALACRPGARSDQSYEEIRRMVAGKTGAEVERLLGAPDLRETVLGDQRWIWWNYTFLAGDQYAPEIRGQVVHLEIVLEKPPGRGPASPSEWRVNGPFSVSYSTASRKP